MEVIRRRTHINRSSNAVWHLYSTRKLIKCKFVASCSVDGHSSRIMWLKCSSNNRVNTNYDLFKEAINEKIAPLQVRGDKVAENRLIVKHTVISHNTQCRAVDQHTTQG